MYNSDNIAGRVKDAVDEFVYDNRKSADFLDKFHNVFIVKFIDEELQDRCVPDELRFYESDLSDALRHTAHACQYFYEKSFPSKDEQFCITSFLDDNDFPRESVIGYTVNRDKREVYIYRNKECDKTLPDNYKSFDIHVIDINRV